MNFSSSVAYSIDYIKELDFYQTLFAIATLLGGIAALIFIYEKWKHRREPDLKSTIYEIRDSVKQFESAPFPVMDFVDGLPQLDDARKREAFEAAMKLRNEHKPLEAIKRFRFLLSMNPCVIG